MTRTRRSDPTQTALPDIGEPAPAPGQPRKEPSAPPTAEDTGTWPDGSDAGGTVALTNAVAVRVERSNKLRALALRLSPAERRQQLEVATDAT